MRLIDDRLFRVNKHVSIRKYFLSFLILLALIIWGSTGYRFIRSVVNSENLNRPVTDLQYTSTFLIDSTWCLWKYPQAKRDPFLLPNKKPKSRILKKTIHKIIKPQLKVNGILIDRSGRLAVIEDQSQSVHFVRKGENFDSLEIIDIRDHLVIIKTNGECFEFRL